MVELEILLSWRSCAPSATITIVRRLPRSLRFYCVGEDQLVSYMMHIDSSAPSTYLGNNRAHVILPAIPRRNLGNEQPVCASANGGHESQPSTVATHHLNDEASLVRECSIEHIIDRITNASQRRVTADGSVGTGHVVIDGTDQTNNVQNLVGLNLLLGQFTSRNEVGQQSRPLGAEDIGTSQATITTADNEGINSPQDHVLSGTQSASALAEGHASSRTDQCTTARQPATDILPMHLADHVAAIDQALVAFEDGVGLAIGVQSHTDDGPHGAVHTGRITTGGEDTNAALLGGIDGMLGGLHVGIEEGRPSQR